MGIIIGIFVSAMLIGFITGAMLKFIGHAPPRTRHKLPNSPPGVRSIIDIKLEVLKAAYVRGDIELDEFEYLVWLQLMHPTSSVATSGMATKGERR